VSSAYPKDGLIGRLPASVDGSFSRQPKSDLHRRRRRGRGAGAGYPYIGLYRERVIIRDRPRRVFKRPSF
jgi:hypothetical protein